MPVVQQGLNSNAPPAKKLEQLMPKVGNSTSPKDPQEEDAEKEDEENEEKEEGEEEAAASAADEAEGATDEEGDKDEIETDADAGMSLGSEWGRECRTHDNCLTPPPCMHVMNRPQRA